jgi:membrane protease YdiL (CAAX protease family)
MAGTIKEDTIFKILIVFLIFLVVNFDPDMAIVFSLMIIADYIIFKDDNFVSYPFEKTTANRFDSLLVTLIIFAGFIFIQSVILRLLTPSITTTSQSIKTLLNLYSSTTPALANNMILSIIALGIIVPFVETRFFFSRIFEILADKFKITGQLNDKMTWILAVFIGAIFAVYHLTARRCGAAATCQNAALLVTFVFGVISVLMVAHYKESKQAVLFHILANTISILFTFKVFSIIGLTP